MSKVLGVIPARYQSSRFPGKPLADLCGKPMVWWVYQACVRASRLDDVVVATDDDRIANACDRYGMKYVLTSVACLTGTDRVGEVSQKIDADLYVNVQGDEPLHEPRVIDEAVAIFDRYPMTQVSNLMTRIQDPVDAVNPTVPKVIASGGRGIYLTRSTAPYPKGIVGYHYYKQVCVYCFTPEALSFFSNYGKAHGKAPIEKIEDIEILRFIENGWPVRYAEVTTSSVAVDTPKDMNRVRAMLASANVVEL